MNNTKENNLPTLTNHQIMFALNVLRVLNNYIDNRINEYDSFQEKLETNKFISKRDKEYYFDIFKNYDIEKELNMSIMTKKIITDFNMEIERRREVK